MNAQTHDIVSSAAEGTCIPLQTINEILKFVFNFDIIVTAVIIIIASIIRMTPATGTEAWIPRNGNRSYDAICTIDANIPSLMRKSDMFDGCSTKTR